MEAKQSISGVGGSLIVKLPEPLFPKEGSPEFIQLYGNIDDVPKKMVKVTMPFPLYYDGNLVKTVSCHSVIAEKFEKVMTDTLNHYGKQAIIDLKLDQYGGCYNKRLKVGSKTQWSVHSWACAFDWMINQNQLKWNHEKAFLAKPEYAPFINFWYAVGAYSLGVEKDFDWMHFQFCQI